jgi:hypothetical protein
MHKTLILPVALYNSEMEAEGVWEENTDEDILT